MTSLKPITVSVTIGAPVEKAWKCWTRPEDIMQWNHASDDWHSPRVSNDVKVGGTFSARMEAKDGSMGFDFNCVYTEVKPLQNLAYTMEDGRKVSVFFEQKGDETLVTETFDPESENSEELQRKGWQSILDNFKKHTESLSA